MSAVDGLSCPVPECDVYFVQGTNDFLNELCAHFNAFHCHKQDLASDEVITFLQNHSIVACVQCYAFVALHLIDKYQLTCHIHECPYCPLPQCDATTSSREPWDPKSLLKHLRSQHRNDQTIHIVKDYLSLHGISTCSTCSQPFGTIGLARHAAKGCVGDIEPRRSGRRNNRKRHRKSTKQRNNDSECDSKDTVSEEPHSDEVSSLSISLFSCPHNECIAQKSQANSVASCDQHIITQFSSLTELFIHIRDEHEHDVNFLTSTSMYELVSFHKKAVQCEKCYLPFPTSGIYRHRARCRGVKPTSAQGSSVKTEEDTTDVIVIDGSSSSLDESAVISSVDKKLKTRQEADGDSELFVNFIRQHQPSLNLNPPVDAVMKAGDQHDRPVSLVPAEQAPSRVFGTGVVAHVPKETAADGSISQCSITQREAYTTGAFNYREEDGRVYCRSCARLLLYHSPF
jgi:hypothetical protein